MAADGSVYVPLPKLPGRLTADLIARSGQALNAVKEYELNLRGNKIPAVENLGATENQFDCIDLSDNDIVKLEGFPRMPRLVTLLVHNNRIARFGSNLGASLPNLQTLGLANNKLVNLGDLDPLASLPNLVRLDLRDNPITKKANYRLHVISRLPKLKLLDFQRVKPAEREAAAKLAPAGGDGEGGKTFTPGEGLPEAPAEEAKKTGPTPEQLTAIRAAIANATTLEEVQRLERALKSGGDVDATMVDAQ